MKIVSSRKSRRFAIGGFLAAALMLGATLGYGYQETGNQLGMNRSQQASFYNYNAGAGNGAGGPVHTNPSSYLIRTLPIFPNPTGYLVTQPPVEPNLSAYL